MKAALVLACLGAMIVQAADSPQQVVQRHVDLVHKGDVNGLMADFADDAVLLASAGVFPASRPASEPTADTGKKNIRKFYENLTNKENFPAAKSMQARIEQLSDEVAILRWKQFPGTPKEVTGFDLFVVRNGKVAVQSIYIDPPKH